MALSSRGQFPSCRKPSRALRGLRSPAPLAALASPALLAPGLLAALGPGPLFLPWPCCFLSLQLSSKARSFTPSALCSHITFSVRHSLTTLSKIELPQPCSKPGPSLCPTLRTVCHPVYSLHLGARRRCLLSTACVPASVLCITVHLSLECKRHKVGISMFHLSLCPQALDQCPVRNSCLINVCWMIE